MNTQIVKTLVDRIAGFTDYNINVIDDHGIIIACSRNKEREGSFHEVAHNMLAYHQDIVEVEQGNSYIGVQPGINMLLEYRNKPIGVIGISGSPEKVKSIALLLKMSLELMLEQEINKQMQWKQKSLRERFFNHLLYSEEKTTDDLYQMAEQLGYKDDVFRVAVFCVPDHLGHIDEIMNILESSEYFRPQDIIQPVRNDQIIILKSFEWQKQMYSKSFYTSYKYILSEMLDTLAEHGFPCRFYIGSFQRKFAYLAESIKHAQWLKTNMDKNNGTRIFFFRNHVGQYLFNCIPPIDRYICFYAYDTFYDAAFKKNFIRIVSALQNNNYNLISSSRQLFVHKNTLINWLNKLRDEWSMNPIQNADDRMFFDLLLTHWQKDTNS